MDHSRCSHQSPLGKLLCEANQQYVSEKVHPHHSTRPRRFLKKTPKLRREEALFPSDNEDSYEEDVSKEDPQHSVSKEEEQCPTGQLQLPGSKPHPRPEDNGK